jgi:predicted ester cyclase
MSIQTNKAIVLRYFLESHNPPYNLDVMDETCSPEFAQAHKPLLRAQLTTFPDLRCTVEDAIAEGDKVALRFTFSGAHLGDLRTPDGTVAPTGRTVTMTATAIFRIAERRIVEEQSTPEWLLLLPQLSSGVRLPAD